MHPAGKFGWLYVSFVLAIVLVAHHMFSTSQVGRDVSESLWGLNIQHYSKLLQKVSRSERQSFERELLENRYAELPATPVLSHPSGIYPDGIAVTVSLPDGSTGHYSLDGSVPTRRHERVPDVIQIKESSVLRTSSFVGAASGKVATASYIVTDMTEVATASLVMDPVYLFDRHAGIYSNPQQRGRAWERPATLALLDPSSGDVQTVEVLVRIHGRGSRRATKKNFRIISTPEDGRIRYWLDSDGSTVSKNQNEWILRHVANEHQAWSDRFILRIARQLRLPATQIRPLVLLVNGEMWGVYDLMERMNVQFLAGKHGIGEYILLHASPLFVPMKTGASYAEWNEVYRFVLENDLSVFASYAYVATQIDIDSLIDYYALSIFMADTDRPQTNIDIYRRTSGSADFDSRWKFAVWDFDGGLSYKSVSAQHDTMAWHLRESLRPELKPVGRVDRKQIQSATKLLRGLMRNEVFRDRFYRRFDLLLETTFSTRNLKVTLDEMLWDYQEVVGLERARLAEDRKGLQYGFDDRMREIETFITDRPEVVGRLLKRHFESTPSVED